MKIDCQYRDHIFTSLTGEANSARPLNLIFHGFPSEKGNRNQDLANFISEKSGNPCLIIHYGGLGQSLGEFSFLGAIVDSIKILKSILSDVSYSELNLIGHSWGGLVALFLADEIRSKISKILLLSPYIFIPEREEMKVVLAAFKSELPHILRNEIGDYIEQVETIRNQFEQLDLNWIRNLQVIYAENDDTVELVKIREVLRHKKIGHKVKTVDQDHSFLKNRESALEVVMCGLEE